MEDTEGTLQRRIENRTATIGVIGLGYVGVPLSVAFVDAGFEVRGYDIDDQRVARLIEADSYIDDINDQRLRTAIQRGFTPRATPDVVADCDVYVIAVPTGMTEDSPDMEAVRAAANTVAEQSGKQETLVIVTSTVYPGATQEVVRPVVETESAPRHLAMVPERLNPGGQYALEEIPLVVGADTDHARTLTTTLIGAIVEEVYPVETTETAELAKTLENTYRMVNIALVNELVTLAEGLQADVWEAIDAAATKPFGYQAFRPGPGVGGHCIPVDPQFLTWRAQDLGTDVSFIDDAHRINERMPQLVADRFEDLLQAREVTLETASVLALGAAYKPNVGDIRRSPALRVIDNLPSSLKLTVVDPHVDSKEVTHEIAPSVETGDIEAIDAAILLVDHDAFNLKAIGNTVPFVFDTRNAMPEDVSATVVTLGSTLGN